MQALLRVTALTCGLFHPVLGWGHSAMFEDYFEFDESNGGEGLTPQMLQRLGEVSSVGTAAVCNGGDAAGYPCLKIDLQSYLPKANMGAASARLNDIWGWTDPVTGDEIAIVGLTDGTSFVNVTDPLNPLYLGKLPSHDNGSDSWRDMKVYQDHVFVVADGRGNRTHGLQIYDLRQLRTVVNPPTTLAETAHFGGFGSAHNIALNEDSGYAYIVGSNQCSGGLYIVDVSIPANPTYAGCFSADGYTHDTQCVVYSGPDTLYVNREICVGYNEDTITIVDVSDKANPVQISRTPYTGSRYTHQGWFLDDAHSVLIMNDEQDEQRRRINTTSYIWDVSDLDNPVELGRYVGPTAAVDHNLYTQNGYVFESNYRAGLRILSSAKVGTGVLEQVAYFDTIPASDSAQFSGLWSSYIYFASGNVIVSDIGNGLFVLRPDWAAIENPAPPPPPPPGNCLVQESFEAGAGGWFNAPSSTCVTGAFVAAAPTTVTNGGVVTQVGGGNTGANAFFTAINSSAGVNDVDAGNCIAVSPTVPVPETATLSVAYFHGQRDGGGDSAGDFFRLELSLDGGNTFQSLASGGDVSTDAVWTLVSAPVPSGSNAVVRMQCSDGTARGDLVECGVDDFKICSTN